ncbi:MAG: hydroxyacid dehydrogenase [Lachnospiraceae bacterium]|nr:hydroxyacid dehydrogenase [Lachnospiraceae bacterium]
MKIAFLEPLGISGDKLKETIESIIGTDHEVTYYNDRNEDPAELVKRSKGAECVVFSNIKFGKDIIEKLPDLKMICVAFTGVDLVDIEYCKERGIRVSNCAGYSTVAVADLVFAFAIDLARNVIPCDRVIREGGTKQGLVGFELAGRKMGIVGAGAIGTRVMEIAKAFDCEVYAYSRTVKDIPGVKFVSFEELLKTCDIISVHVPQTAETKGMFGAKEFAMMKEGALFINLARGPIVDSEALANALNAGHLAGAAVDVYEKEPPIDKDHVLLHAKNLIATPHIAFASQQAFEKRAVIVGNNLKAYAEGNPINVIC